MKIQLTLTLKDEDGNTVDSAGGYINHSEHLSTLKIIQLVKQWVSESVCSLMARQVK